MSNVAVDALLAQGSCPSFMLADDGVLLNLRGANMNTGAVPADMVPIRICGVRRFVASVQRRRLRPINDVEKHLYAGTVPKDVGELLACLSNGLSERISNVVSNINDQVYEFAERLVDGSAKQYREVLHVLRREVIRLKRYIALQRQAMAPIAGNRAVGCRRYSSNRVVRALTG